VGALLAALPLAALPFLVTGSVPFVACAVIAVVGLVVSGIVIWDSSRPPELHPGIVALRAGLVSWLFLEKHRNPHTKADVESVLRLGLTVGGEQIVLPLIAGREEEFFRAATAIAPRATSGWTPELEMAYLEAPASLLKDQP
jgi:hypothetical protein